MEKMILTDKRESVEPIDHYERNKQAINNFKDFMKVDYKSKSRMAGDGYNSTSTLPIFQSKILVSNINYYLDVSLIKTQTMEQKGYNKYN